MTAHDLRPGDLVTFPFGAMTIHARVIEDRGHLGIGAARSCGSR